MSWINGKVMKDMMERKGHNQAKFRGFSIEYIMGLLIKETMACRLQHRLHCRKHNTIKLIE